MMDRHIAVDHGEIVNRWLGRIINLQIKDFPIIEGLEFVAIDQLGVVQDLIAGGTLR